MKQFLPRKQGTLITVTCIQTMDNNIIVYTKNTNTFACCHKIKKNIFGVLSMIFDELKSTSNRV